MCVNVYSEYQGPFLHRDGDDDLTYVGTVQIGAYVCYYVVRAEIFRGVTVGSTVFV